MTVLQTVRRVLLVAPLVLTPAVFAQKGDPAQGATLYSTKCAMCHGADGSGSTAMGKRFKLRDLRSAEVQQQTDAQLSDIIAKGKKGATGSMPAYESLGHDGIQNVIAHLRQMAKSK